MLSDTLDTSNGGTAFNRSSSVLGYIVVTKCIGGRGGGYQ